MAQILIYSKNSCPYCDKAKNLLKNKSIPFDETLITDPDEMIALKKRTGWMTFPQIFIEGKLVGGFDDLNLLSQKGELEKYIVK